MLLATPFTGAIDADVTASELSRAWRNGNKEFVLESLENDHCGLTALFLVCHGWEIGESGRNQIANHLIDARMRIAQK